MDKETYKENLYQCALAFKRAGDRYSMKDPGDTSESIDAKRKEYGETKTRLIMVGQACFDQNDHECCATEA